MCETPSFADCSGQLLARRLWERWLPLRLTAPGEGRSASLGSGVVRQVTGQARVHG